MKPIENKLVLETEGLTETQHEFKVAQNKRMYEILSSNIYTDKIMAVIREYSCNAYDAQVAAGNVDIPFQVHLPNMFEPYFSIRDFGTGLSERDLTELYTTYGLSTKVGENNSIGMLGLGSKSAFAYTDQFTVTSFLNGESFTYSCFLSREGVPTITKLVGEKTTEPNGVLVTVPVLPSDFDFFRYRAQRAFTYFPVQPEVMGNPQYDPQQKPKAFYVGEGYEIPDGIGSESVLVQGTVAYPIKRNRFNEGTLSEEVKTLLSRSNIILYAPIGSVDISASREELNYNNHTQEYLISRLNKVVEDVTSNFYKEFDGVKTIFHAQKIYNDRVKGTLYSKLGLVGVELDNGIVLDGPLSRVELLTGEDQSICVQNWDGIDLKNGGSGVSPFVSNSASYVVNYTGTEKRKFGILVFDKPVKAPARVVYENFLHQEYTQVYVIRGKQANKPVKADEFIELLTENLSSVGETFDIKYVSNIEVKPKEKIKKPRFYTTEKVDKVQDVFRGVVRKRESGLTLEQLRKRGYKYVLVLDSRGDYINFNGDKVNIGYGGRERRNIFVSKIISWFDGKIAILNLKQLKACGKKDLIDSGFIDLASNLESILASLINKNKFQITRASMPHTLGIRSYNIGKFERIITTHQVNDPVVIKYFNKLKTYIGYEKGAINNQGLEELCRHSTRFKEAISDTTTLINRVTMSVGDKIEDVLEKRYPLFFKLLDNYTFSEEEIVEYLNTRKGD